MVLPLRLLITIKIWATLIFPSETFPLFLGGRQMEMRIPLPPLGGIVPSHYATICKGLHRIGDGTEAKVPLVEWC